MPVRALRTWWPLALMAGVGAFAAVFILRYGLSAHELQLDEFDTVAAGRRLDGAFFQTLFAVSPVGRGPERLAALVYALPSALFDNTATVFRASHILFGLIYMSAALPVYALARGLGLERWQAALPTVAAILTPWMLFGGTLLNVTVAYPTAMALAWATWRTMVRPSWRADSLLVLFALAGAMARESHALFAVAAGLAVSLQVWRDWSGETVWWRVKSFPGRIVRSHPLLVAAAGVVLVAVGVYGTHRLAGSAYQPTSSSSPVTVRGVLDATWKAASELTMGTGYLPMIFAVPWLTHETLWPRRRESGAFAAVAVLMFTAFVAMVVYFAATTAGASDDERYVAVLAGLPPLAAAVALFRREVGPVAVGVSGILLARAVVTQGLYPLAQPYGYFLAPARLFFTVVIQGQLSSRIPFSDSHIATTLLLAFAAAAVIVALLLTRRHSRSGALGAVIATFALGAPIALSAAGGIYDGDHFENLATFPSLTFEQQSWVDAATGSAPAVVWDYAPNGDLRIPYEANQAAFFNRSMVATVHVNGMPSSSAVGSSISVTVDPRSGVVRTSSPMPRYLLAPERFTSVGFAGVMVAGPSTVFGPLPLFLERLRSTARASYTVRGLKPKAG
jgi:hypothetical protein